MPKRNTRYSGDQKSRLVQYSNVVCINRVSGIQIPPEIQKINYLGIDWDKHRSVDNLSTADDQQIHFRLSWIHFSVDKLFDDNVVMFDQEVDEHGGGEAKSVWSRK